MRTPAPHEDASADFDPKRPGSACIAYRMPGSAADAVQEVVICRCVLRRVIGAAKIQRLIRAANG